MDDVIWHLRPGDRIKRIKLHDKFGGSGQNGITTCSKSKAIILAFQDRFLSAKSIGCHEIATRRVGSSPALALPAPECRCAGNHIEAVSPGND